MPTLHDARSQVSPVDDAEAVLRAARDVVVPHLDDVRGNLTLPTRGDADTTLRWTSSAPQVISAEGIVSRPVHGGVQAEVHLTVEASRGAATAQHVHRATVRPMPLRVDLAAYFFPHFIGEDTPTSEAVYFAVSEGNSVSSWRTLNGGRPVLESELGERGLRDPFVIRSPEGDRFFLLATDLKIYGEPDFLRAQARGSTAMMVWESTDLVTWSDQRMIQVSSELAGNTWAPEAIWSPEFGCYVVYWASNLYASSARDDRRNSDSYNRMMYATTRDFVTFSPARVWIDVERAPGYGTIDSTVIRHEGSYYRFTKDERPDVMKVFQERSPDLLRATHGSLGSSWDLLATEIGADTLTHGEGPTVFKSNTEDRWYLFQDWPPYGGGHGYVPFETTDLDSGVWTPTPGASLPTSPRHGAVLPITREEHERLTRHYP